jgi:hypothetical protein
MVCDAARQGWLYFCASDGRVFSCESNTWVYVDDLTGPQGAQGATGVAGQDGPSGATGAQGPGETPASDAVWQQLVLGSDITVDDVFPACQVTRTGDISLRGHVTLFPVPAIGGMLIGILPRNPTTGVCPCSIQDGGFEVVGTTTGLAFSNATGNAEIPDVCIV